MKVMDGAKNLNDAIEDRSLWLVPSIAVISFFFHKHVLSSVLTSFEFSSQRHVLDLARHTE